MKSEPRKIADNRYVVELPLLEDELEYALIEINPFTKIVMCFRCGRETCQHAKDVRSYLRGRGEYE